MEIQNEIQSKLDSGVNLTKEEIRKYKARLVNAIVYKTDTDIEDFNQLVDKDIVPSNDGFVTEAYFKRKKFHSLF